MRQDKRDRVPIRLSVVPCSGSSRHGLETRRQRRAKRDNQP
jgi:hypothetical protein